MQHKLMFLIFLSFTFFLSAQKYDSFKTKLQENLSQSQNTAQLEYGEFSDFTLQQTIEYFGEILKKESELQLIEVALAYYSHLKEEKALDLLKSTTFHPVFGGLALKALFENNPSVGIQHVEKILAQYKNEKKEYPFLQTIYFILGEDSSEKSSLLLSEMLTYEKKYLHLILAGLGKQAKSLPLLLPYLNQYPAEVCQAIGEFGTEEELLLLLPLLKGQNSDAQIFAIKALGQRKVPAALKDLLLLLKSPSWLVRRYVLWALKEFSVPTETLLPSLEQSFLKDIKNQSIAFEVIVSLPHVELKMIESLFSGQVFETQVMMLNKLRFIQNEKDEAWTTFLLTQLDSNSPKVMLATVQLLEQYPVAQLLEKEPKKGELLGALLGHPSVLLQEAVLYTIGECKISSFVRKVIPFLSSDEVSLQREAARTLGKIALPNTLSFLIGKASEKNLNSEVQAEVQLAILKIKKRR